MWQALGPVFCPKQHREDELGLIVGCVEGKTNKQTNKNCLKPFKRASLNLSVRWWWKEPILQLPGAQPFISFSLFSFLLGKKMFSPVWSPHYINSMLWKHLRVVRVKKKEMSASEKSALLGRESEQLYSGCSEGQAQTDCQSSLQSVIFS